jgi:beta-1,4-mannosyl-glycoprotein beta-1,4-N-acetylglucosaminyltransferase
MAIYDCFQFFNEEDILDIRLNILSPFVDYFIITESIYDHQGNLRELVFNRKKFEKFNHKINYIIVNDIPLSAIKKHQGGHSLIEQCQRNAIMRGLERSSNEDLIIISDVDEIPDLTKLNLYNKKNYAVFSQRMFNFKLNLMNITESNWHGSRMCLKKNLKSPQYLRNIKFKKYPFWRLDKIRNIQVIENGGWHFSYLQDISLIVKKIKSFSHGEFNNPLIVNENIISEKINNGVDIFNRNIKYKKVEIDKSFPEYIYNNIAKFKKWII